jgi:hypothetical protein
MRANQTMKAEEKTVFKERIEYSLHFSPKPFAFEFDFIKEIKNNRTTTSVKFIRTLINRFFGQGNLFN